MATEIERKFLVSGEGWQEAEAKSYSQGYLNRDPHRTVRVRIGGDSAFITVKGISEGASRAEFEYPVPIEDAKEILGLCEQPLIEKTRRIIEHAGMTWEIDEFHGVNEGLVVAEIELESEDQTFEKPDWVGEEVTDQRKYYNSQLSLMPYSEWDESRR